MTTSSMTPEQLLENFRSQQKTAAENIRQLETELAKQKELFVKLQGAIEGMTILAPPEEPEEEITSVPEASPEAVTETMS